MWRAELAGVLQVRRSSARAALVVELEGGELEARPFYTHELTYVVLRVQRQVDEARAGVAACGPGDGGRCRRDCWRVFGVVGGGGDGGRVSAQR